MVNAGYLFPDSDREFRTTIIAITQWWCHAHQVGQDHRGECWAADCEPVTERPCEMGRPGFYWNPTSISQWRSYLQRQRAA